MSANANDTNDDDFVVTPIDSDVMITDYTGQAEDIVIPETINGLRSASAADTLDQTSGAGDPGGIFRAHGKGQSFTAGLSGYLNKIDLYMVDYGSSGIVFTLSIYDGESVSGAALATATFRSIDIPYNPGAG